MCVCVCVCVCVCFKRHSINEMNFVLVVGNRKHCLQFQLFQGNQYWRVPENCQHYLLYWLLHRKLFLHPKVSVFPLQWLLFFFSTQRSLFRPFVNILLTITCFSVPIAHPSKDFTWFALLGHQKFDDRTLFKPGELWFAIIVNSLKPSISARLKGFFLWTNFKQCSF